MSIMRRGPLDRYPAGWLLEQAAASQLEGSIELFTSRPVTVFLEQGQVYAAVDGVGGARGAEDPDLDDEVRARVHTVARLVDALCEAGGEYYHDPMGRHPWRGRWAWDVDDLFLAARARSPEATAAFVLGNRRVQLAASRTEPVTIEPDGWAVLAALTQAATAEEVRGQLGWTHSRLLAAVSRLSQAGTLMAQPDASAPAPSPARHAAPSDDALEREIDLAMEQAIQRSAVTGETDLDAEPERVKVDPGVGANSPASNAWMAWNRLDPTLPAPLEASADWVKPEDPAPSRRRSLRRRAAGDTTADQ